MSFSLKNILSGRVFKSNRLIQNHVVRVCNKIDNSDDSVLYSLISSTSFSTLFILEHFYFDVPDYKYNDGRVEKNPFKQHLDKLDEHNSYSIFKWCSGLFFSGMIINNLFKNIPVNVDTLRDSFFRIYEYNDEDKMIYFDLYNLWMNYKNNNEGPDPQVRLYDYIFEKGFKIQLTETLYFSMFFPGTFMLTFKDKFLNDFLELIKSHSSK